MNQAIFGSIFFNGSQKFDCANGGGGGGGGGGEGFGKVFGIEPTLIGIGERFCMVTAGG